MLARRHPTHRLPSPPPTHQHPPSSATHPSHVAAQELLDYYLETQQHSFPATFSLDDASLPSELMTSAYDFANPTIRIQQSTPTPATQLAAGFAPVPKLPASIPDASAATSNMNSWNTYGNMHSSGQSLHTPSSGRNHHRASSASSTGSTGSQYQTVSPATSYPSFANNLPTPTHTPTHDSFLNNNTITNNNFVPNTPTMDPTMAAHFSMKQALMDQNVNDDEVPGFAHSARHSVSSYGPHSPATPRTVHGDDFSADDKFKMPPSDLRQQHTVPKFERTYTDAALDNFYDPTTIAVQSQPMTQPKSTPNASLLSPYRASNSNDIVQRTLQAAQNARSQSPSSSTSRGVSPFRQNSPWCQPNLGYKSPGVRVGTAAQAREQKLEADAAYAMKQNPSSNDDNEPKTISPKEVTLDYRETDEDSKVTLFPDSGASEYESQYSGGDQYRNATQSSFDTTSGHGYSKDNWATPQFSPHFAATTATPSLPSTTIAFPTASISGTMGLTNLPTSQYRSSGTLPSTSDPTPDFPAHLHSMESSASEAEPHNSQASSDYILQKPASSAADSGTYTCTYHGCTQRFETPQKLQKHKREGHRSANPATIDPGMTSAALLERNSQAGPHKCERINPTTGKPCNTIFSRPYDLTRHEDTIHNARKQKVRCALCVEDKTFSRNDALTRHMRVVHPEVDFPGKHRRRGGTHE